MRALSIHVQPERSGGIDAAGLTAAFAEIAAMRDVVQHHHFDHGHDKMPYLNFTFGTLHAVALWKAIWTRLYEDAAHGPHMRAASMAMCSGEDGWASYVLLYHFDPAVKTDTLEADTPR